MHGLLKFRYALLPLAGAPDRIQLGELGQKLAAGLRTVQLRAADIAIYRRTRSVSTTAGQLRLDGPALVTSLRQPAGAVEVRMLNPHPRRITAILLLAPALATAQRAELTDYEVNPVATVQLIRNRHTLTLKPKQIVVVWLALTP